MTSSNNRLWLYGCSPLTRHRAVSEILRRHQVGDRRQVVVVMLALVSTFSHQGEAIDVVSERPHACKAQTLCRYRTPCPYRHDAAVF
jgi:hypothetical protein